MGLTCVLPDARVSLTDSVKSTTDIVVNSFWSVELAASEMSCRVSEAKPRG